MIIFVRLICLIVVVLLPIRVSAQFEKRLIADKYWSAIAGANDLLTIHEAIAAAQDLYIPNRFTDESTLSEKLAGITYRFTKSIFLENIVDHFIFLTQHEVFGHGARFREFGVEDVYYQLHLFPPFGDGGGSTLGYRTWDDVAVLDKIVSMGGSQANAVLAAEQRYRLLSQGRMTHRQSNLYLAGMLDLTHYVLRTSSNFIEPSSNDVKSYIFLQYGANKGPAELDRLKQEVLLNFVDPMQWYSVYNLIVTNWLLGEEEMSIPMIDFGGWSYLANLRIGLTTFGTEYFLENHARVDSTVFGLTLAMDRSAPSRIAANMRYLPLTDRLSIDAQLQLWNQLPWNSPHSTDRVIGGLFTVTPSFSIPIGERKTSVVAQLGYKSEGFAEGEMLADGLIVRFGLSFW